MRPNINYDRKNFMCRGLRVIKCSILYDVSMTPISSNMRYDSNTHFPEIILIRANEGFTNRVTSMKGMPKKYAS